MSTQETVQRTNLKQIQRDVSSPSITVETRRKGIGGAETLHGELDAMADSFDMTGFKCAHEQCGLVHNHDTTKHRASDSFGMGDEDAASMEANPNCHCGLNELARSGHDEAPSSSRANSMAPIPDSMSRHIDRSV